MLANPGLVTLQFNRVFSMFTILCLTFVFVRANQALLPANCVVILFFFMLNAPYLRWSYPLFNRYFFFIGAFFVISIISTLTSEFDWKRFLLSYSLYAFPPIAGLAYYYSNISTLQFRKFLFYITLVQIITFSIQTIIQLSKGTLAFGTDWAVGTMAVPGVTAHTAGVLISLTGIYWFQQYYKDHRKEKKYFYLSLISFFLLFLTGTTHAFFALFGAITLYVFLKSTSKYRFLYILLLLLLFSIYPFFSKDVVWNITGGINSLKALAAGDLDYLLHNRALKIKAFFIGLEYLYKNPEMSFFGVGMGNFNDRATAFALFPSYGAQIQQLLGLQPSQISLSLIGRNWVKIGSVSNSIYSDMISVIIQLGLAGCAFCLVLIKKILNVFKKSATSRFVTLYISYVFFLGFFENWLQYPQVSAFISLLLFDLYRQTQQPKVI